MTLAESAPVFCLVVCPLANRTSLLAASSGVSGNIDLWDLSFFSKKVTLQGHSRQVTAIAFDAGNERLYSAARDGIKTWDMTTFECIGTQNTYRGSVYCMAATNKWLFAGGQDTAIHGFEKSGVEVTLRGHRGFVFSICVWDEKRFFSAGGDAMILLWQLTGDGATWETIAELKGHTGAVLNLALDEDFLYSVSRDGSLKIWDLETLMLTRSLVLQLDTEMLTVAVNDDVVYGGSTDGIWAWSKPSLSFLGCLPGADEPISLTTRGETLLVGDAKGSVVIWRPEADLASSTGGMPVGLLTSSTGGSSRSPKPRIPRTPSLSGSLDFSFSVAETLPQLLSSFVALRTVSGDPSFRLECFNGAKWLKNLAVKLGFDARLEQPSDDSINPIVYARFGDVPGRKTIVMYGHYDVVPAGTGWKSDPWSLRGHNGFLYGRGVTDDKGPVLAAMLAASQLMATGELNYNIRFLIEGEEENGSAGVLESVAANSGSHSGSIGPADLLLISNNYWIGESRPCIVYGMRGVIYFEVTLSGPARSNHSGVEGGAFREPMSDLMQVLASLSDPATGKVRVKGFYDQVRPVTEEEKELYADIDFDLGRYTKRTGLCKLIPEEQTAVDLLMQRWRFPNLSLTGIETVAGPNNPTIIPKAATARLSIRTVPDQDHSDLVAAFETHLQSAFEGLYSRNSIQVKVVRQGAWWLGDMKKNPFFRLTEQALETVWEQKPMYTREGGSIPILSRLETALGAQSLILPLGQALDNAHLPNERISLQGLVKGVDVFRELFKSSCAE